MLGLLSALCRRDRILASQQFDARVATTLRPYSQSYQREETLKLLQRRPTPCRPWPNACRP